MPAKIIQEIACSTAEEFLSKTSPFDELWRSTGGVNFWIFRGHGDASWRLSPSAMRPNAFVYAGIGRAVIVTPKNLEEQLAEEDRVVRAFAEGCIKAGRPLPEDSQLLRSAALPKYFFNPQLRDDLDNGIEWPNPIARSVFALAQHHGVPTRLLDWTRDPLVATYFACEHVARWKTDSAKFPFEPKSDSLSVWALRTIVFEHLADWVARSKDDAGQPFDPHIGAIEAPYADNPRLAAQKGLFTLVTHHHKPASHLLPAVEDVLRAYELAKYKVADGEQEDWPLARKISLPHSQARRLLRILGEAGFDASNVAPDYDGVRIATTERQFWE